MKEKTWQKLNKGSMTLFFCLTILLVMALLCSVVESARVYASMVHSKSQAYRAFETEFSYYAEQLFNDYGLMALWEQNDLGETMKGDIYMENKADYDYVDLIKSQLIEVKDINKEYITDNSGQEFVEQILNYEKYELPSEIIAELTSNYTSYEDYSKEEESEDISPVEDYDNATGTVSNQNIADDYKSAIENIKGKDYSEPYGTIREKVSFYSQEKTDIESAIEVCKQYEEIKEGVEKKYGTTGKNIGESENQQILESMLKDIDALEDEYEKYIDSLNEEETTTSTKATADSRSTKDGSKTKTTASDESAKDGSKTKDSHEEKNTTTMEDTLVTLLAEKSKDLANLQQSLSMPAETELDSESEGMLEAAKSILSDGALSLVVPTDFTISSAAIYTANLPSCTCQWEENQLSELNNKLMYAMYLRNNFTNALTPEEDNALQYELEYIIAGNDTDKDNLLGVAERILLMRQVLNTTYLLADTEKIELCLTLAETISAAILMPFLAPVIEIILVEAWALAESVIDVRNLLSGEEVKLIKTQADWNTSLENMGGLMEEEGKNTLKDIEKKETKSKDSTEEEKNNLLKQDYEMYLTLILMAESAENLTYRAMDLIQSNMCKKYNSNFRMNKCIVSADANFKFSIGKLMSVLPLFSEDDDETGGYTITVKAAYSY